MLYTLDKKHVTEIVCANALFIQTFIMSHWKSFLFWFAVDNNISRTQAEEWLSI